MNAIDGCVASPPVGVMCVGIVSRGPTGPLIVVGSMWILSNFSPVRVLSSIPESPPPKRGASLWSHLDSEVFEHVNAPVHRISVLEGDSTTVAVSPEVHDITLRQGDHGRAAANRGREGT